MKTYTWDVHHPNPLIPVVTVSIRSRVKSEIIAMAKLTTTAEYPDRPYIKFVSYG